MFENQPRVGPGGAPPSRPGLDGGGGRAGSRRRRLRTRPALPSRRKRAPAATSAEGPGRGREPGSAPSSPRRRALTSCQKDRVGDAGRRDAFIPAAPRGESRATGSAAAARPPVPGTGAGAGAPRGAARARVVVTGDGEGGANPGRNARAHTRPRGGGGSGRLLLGRGGGGERGPPDWGRTAPARVPERRVRRRSSGSRLPRGEANPRGSSSLRHGEGRGYRGGRGFAVVGREPRGKFECEPRLESFRGAGTWTSERRQLSRFSILAAVRLFRLELPPCCFLFS